jgi:hypothetical protein
MGCEETMLVSVFCFLFRWLQDYKIGLQNWVIRFQSQFIVMLNNFVIFYWSGKSTRRYGMIKEQKVANVEPICHFDLLLFHPVQALDSWLKPLWRLFFLFGMYEIQFGDYIVARKQMADYNNLSCKQFGWNLLFCGL